MSACLVLGGAGCVWEDVDAALDIGQFDGVCTCNDVTAAWPGPIAAAVSLHSDSFPRWLTQRDRAGRPRPDHVLGHLAASNDRRRGEFVTSYTEYRFPGQDRSGSSGLFALKVALIDLGFDKAVLCGVPMTAAPGHFFNPEAWRAADAHRKGWLNVLPQIKDRVRSVSGWTMDLLGAPDAAWLTS